jgi:hypothetical protein
MVATVQLNFYSAMSLVIRDPDKYFSFSFIFQNLDVNIITHVILYSHTYQKYNGRESAVNKAIDGSNYPG